MRPMPEEFAAGAADAVSAGFLALPAFAAADVSADDVAPVLEFSADLTSVALRSSVACGRLGSEAAASFLSVGLSVDLSVGLSFMFGVHPTLKRKWRAICCEVFTASRLNRKTVRFLAVSFYWSDVDDKCAMRASISSEFG
jgi:hypothetical protein